MAAGWSLLIVSMKDRRLLRRDPDGSVTAHADLSAFTESPLKDMVVDDWGRAWVGCFGFDLMSFADPQPAPLMRVDPDGTASLAADELMFPNGSVITPARRRQSKLVRISSAEICAASACAQTRRSVSDPLSTIVKTV